MKKIIILLLGLVLFNLSFSDGTYLKGVDVNKIKNVLEKDGFEFDEDGEYYFFKKRNEKFEQKIDIWFYDEKPYSIDIASYHFHMNPNQEAIKNNLSNMVKKVNSGISNETIKKALLNSVDKMHSKAPQGEPGTKDYIEKVNKLYEIGDYYIRTMNTNTEKSINLSCD